MGRIGLPRGAPHEHPLREMVMPRGAPTTRVPSKPMDIEASKVPTASRASSHTHAQERPAS